MQKKLLIVDKKDKAIKEEAREKCHIGSGILHRAITVFIFDDNNNLLITKRSKRKKLWLEFWESSCSTHVYKGETYEQAGERRLPEELGFSTKLKFLFKFQYQVKYKNVGSENELCALLIGKYNQEIKPNLKEVSDYKWISLVKLKKDISQHPEKYAPWLKIALKGYLKYKKEKSSKKSQVFGKF